MQSLLVFVSVRSHCCRASCVFSLQRNFAQMQVKTVVHNANFDAYSAANISDQLHRAHSRTQCPETMANAPTRCSCLCNIFYMHREAAGHACRGPQYILVCICVQTMLEHRVSCHNLCVLSRENAPNWTLSVMECACCVRAGSNPVAPWAATYCRAVSHSLHIRATHVHVWNAILINTIANTHFIMIHILTLRGPTVLYGKQSIGVFRSICFSSDDDGVRSGS